MGIGIKPAADIPSDVSPVVDHLQQTTDHSLIVTKPEYAYCALALRNASENEIGLAELVINYQEISGLKL